MAARWLLKSDPETYSFSDLEREGQTVWDGVSNNLALKHLRSVRRGDQALIYHTGDEKAVVGVAEVMSDPTWHRAGPPSVGLLTCVCRG